MFAIPNKCSSDDILLLLLASPKRHLVSTMSSLKSSPAMCVPISLIFSSIWSSIISLNVFPSCLEQETANTTLILAIPSSFTHWVASSFSVLSFWRINYFNFFSSSLLEEYDLFKFYFPKSELLAT